jgi:catechol 2,3-dioxygenase-like lactoylglutathione lyase family enzyme
MKINGLSHITFICADLNKTAQMLKEVFNAEEIYSSGDKTFSTSREKFFKIAGIWIAIMEGAAVEKTYNHVAFHVDKEDLEQFTQKIEALGLTLLPSRKRESAEGESLYFYDYDNHLFELHTGNLDTRLQFYNAL